MTAKAPNQRQRKKAHYKAQHQAQREPCLLCSLFSPNCWSHSSVSLASTFLRTHTRTHTCTHTKHLNGYLPSAQAPSQMEITARNSGGCAEIMQTPELQSDLMWFISSYRSIFNIGYMIIKPFHQVTCLKCIRHIDFSDTNSKMFIMHVKI